MLLHNLNFLVHHISLYHDANFVKKKIFRVTEVKKGVSDQKAPANTRVWESK